MIPLALALGVLVFVIAPLAIGRFIATANADRDRADIARQSANDQQAAALRRYQITHRGAHRP